MTKQTKRGGKGRPQPKVPVVVKYVIENIKKGVYPTKGTLEDIFNEVDNRHYKEIALALLEQTTTTPQKPTTAVPEPPRATNKQAATPRPQKKQERPKVDYKKVLAPGAAGLNVVGNVRKNTEAV